MGDSPVPWLATAAAVVLVVALSWLATDEPPVVPDDAGVGAARPVLQTGP